ncbi:MAG: hypothetical protein ACK2U0_16230 [Candidatus Promineifilaceae bacterium]|jgi:hypothetical protein
MKVRPLGITLLAIVFIALGLLSFLWSLLVFGVGGLNSLFSSIFTLSPQLSSGLWSGVVGMLGGAVQLATGIGLLGIKRWGWYLAFLAIGLNVILGVLGLFSGGILACLCGTVGLIIPVAIVIYLIQPRIRDLFGIGAPPSKY